MQTLISIRGAREHNLKAVHVELPRKLAALVRLCLIAIVVLATSSTAIAAETQIVVQWLYGQGSRTVTGSNWSLSETVWRVESILEAHENDLYFVDGNDVGSGTINFFLYARDENVDATVNAVVRLYEQKLLPDGMRVGVAAYKNEARSDWDFRPVFPVGLEQFNITY